MAAEQAEHQPRRKSNRGINWSDEATETLIELWAEESIQLALDHAKSSKETRAVYQTLKVQMENRKFPNFTVQDLVNKMKKLRQKYKQEKDKSSKSGTGRRNKWKFFDMMDRIMYDRPQVKPPLLVDSSAPADAADLPDPETVDDHEGESEKEYNEDQEDNEPLTPTSEQVVDAEEEHQPKDQEDHKSVAKPKVPTKKRKRSNIEKSLDVFCDKFTQISKEETERYLRAEELRHKREIDFQLKQTQMENERRRLEREHEMNVLKLILSQQGQQGHHPYTGHGLYPRPETASYFYPGMPTTPMLDPDGSDTSSFTSL